MHAKFQIGERETHVIEVLCLWNGAETIKIDGKEIWRTPAFRLKFSSTINFSVGRQEVHSVTIKLRPFTPMAQVFVDDKLVIKQLFPQLARAEEMNCPLCYVVFMIIGIGLAALLGLIHKIQLAWHLDSPLITFFVVIVAFEVTRALVRSRHVKWLNCGHKSEQQALDRQRQ